MADAREISHGRAGPAAASPMDADACRDDIPFISIPRLQLYTLTVYARRARVMDSQRLRLYPSFGGRCLEAAYYCNGNVTAVTAHQRTKIATHTA